MRQSLVSALVVLGLSCASGRAAFEKVTVDIDGTAFGSFSRVLRVDPLTLWISDFFEGSFETFIVVESDGGYSFAFDSRTGFPAGTETSFQGDPVVRGEHLFYVTAVSEAGNGGDNRAEGVVAQYRDGVLTEYGPRARTLLGSGTETAPFYYRMGDANA